MTGCPPSHAAWRAGRDGVHLCAAGQFAMDGCVAGCDKTWQADGECDESCNVYECDYDGEDCFAGVASGRVSHMLTARARAPPPRAASDLP